ncbi:DNA topology modulation protein FlaR [Roseibium sediminicola]|uniref:DNA topology modulation protein FlaR n=1 Tax=Roseibium sediminicola TaxID=2933272 RepID=A0ABT0GZ89_9HYPH|nr:DNA topology modulation protein FlaR [Roseibium sp. CAU 1639]MCK7614752.1 DNA topology modulation protein FlaR [Roseibium sp. CAU 1639]
MKRVMIVGGPGSGKSMLATALGETTGLPVFHMDKIHYRPGWVERPRAEKDRLTHEVHIQDRWIFEGGHSSTYAERIARADTFIWLDVPVGLRIARVLKRSVRYYGRSRPDLPEGCPERFNWQTAEFLRFIWRTRHSARAKLDAVYQAPPAHLTAHRLTSLAEVRAFLAELGKTSLS